MFPQTFFWNIVKSRFTPFLGSCLHVCQRIALKRGINPYSNFGVKFLVPRTCRSSTGAMPRPNYAIYLLAGSLIAAEKESKEESELVKSVKLAVLSMQVRVNFVFTYFPYELGLSVVELVNVPS